LNLAIENPRAVLAFIRVYYSLLPLASYVSFAFFVASLTVVSFSGIRASLYSPFFLKSLISSNRRSVADQIILKEDQARIPSIKAD